MTRELIHQLERLGQERHRLEVLLSRQPAWLAWKQLSEASEPADEFGRYTLARRKAELENELLRDPLFSAHRSLMAAIQVFEGLVSQRPALEERPEPAEHCDASTELDLKAEAAALSDQDQPAEETVDDVEKVPARTSADNSHHDIEVVALSDLRGSRVVMQAAMIHDSPPGRARGEAALTDADAPPDQLTRIRRIDKDLAAALIARGVRHYAQIAAFGPSDVRALSAALGLGRRISRENWIEQAALLAMKAGAAPAVGLRNSQSPPLTLPVEGEVGDTGSRAVPGTLETHDGTMSPKRSVSDAAIAGAIAERHVGRASAGQEIAATVMFDRSEVNAESDVDTCTGEIPAFDALRQAAQLDASFYVPEMVRDAALRIAAAIRAVRSGEHVSDGPRFEPVRSDATVREHRTAPSAPDDLALLDGVDENIAALLRAEGITRFYEIAAWNPAAVAHFQALLGGAVSISRLGWIEQAALLARGIMTVYASRRTRGEFAARVPRSIEPAVRNEGFAAWLSAHAHSHTLSHVPTRVALDAHNPPEPRAIPSTELAHVGPVAQPIDDEFEEVFGTDVAGGSEVVEMESHKPSAVLESELQAMPGHAGAEVIPLRHVLDMEADEPDLPQNASPAAGQPDIFELGDDGHAAIAAASPAKSVVATALAPDDAARITIGTAEPEPEFVPDDLRPATPPPRPMNIADRITAIERDAAELTGSSRRVLDRFKQGTHLRAGQTAPAAGNTAAEFAEVDVRVVTRETHAAGAQTVRVPHVGSSPEVDHNVAFDSKDYAAYRDTVEEAIIEIVPATHASSDRMLPAAASESSGAIRSPRQVGHNEIGKIRRFLKALRGE